MRLTALLGPCLGVGLLATAGCDPVRDNLYFREGIGTDLSRPELADATQLQNIYIAHICRQAGLAGPLGEGSPLCDPPSAGAWPEIVQAGMNDIDLRCDSYLAWLDDRRRSHRPIIQQISSMRSLTQTILDASGVGPHPMTIVGNAFGFASSTFTNINSRLLLEVNQSTIQEVVLKNQEKFRRESDYREVRNRSEAIYMLRMYLRICMPFTIETDINTSVTLIKRGAGVMTVENPLVMTDGTLGGSPPPAAVPFVPRAPIARPPRGPLDSNPAHAKFIKDFDAKADPVVIVEPQLLKLCVPQEWLGKLDDPAISGHVTALIQVYQQSAPARLPREQPTGLLTRPERLQLNRAHCTPSDNVRNYHEARIGGITRPKTIALLNNVNIQGPKLGDAASSAEIRKRIKDIKTSDFGSNLQLKDPWLADQLTRDLDDALIRLDVLTKASPKK